MILVNDPIGESLNRTVCKLSRSIREHELNALEEIESAAKALLWRYVTRPQPLSHNQGIDEICRAIQQQVAHFKNKIQDRALLTDLTESVKQIGLGDPLTGRVLLESCQEVGAKNAVVVAASRPATQDLRTWLEPYGIAVVTQSELARLNAHFEITYAVGPPKFFGSSVVTSPATNELSYLLPSWFKDRSIPLSAISAHSEGKIQIRSRLYSVGPALEVAAKPLEENLELESYLPQPIWSRPRGATTEHVEEDRAQARKIYLSGEFSIWLDDGERIRTIEIGNPPGERVSYTNVGSIKRGTFLLLRQGVSEYGALADASKKALGNLAREIEFTQSNWKQALGKKINEHSKTYIIKQLEMEGIATPNRAFAWVEKDLICPQKKSDFLALLRWLQVPVEPTLSNAMALRRQTYKTRNDIHRQLEKSIANADMNHLERNGFLQVGYETEGFRGILATRVLAISPDHEIVPKSNLRVPSSDRSARWLE
ncbi:hypothetical protein FQA45_09800 [Glutamicibacter halophytocola]|uniref:Uncharacterized protein n=2 Tax=Glutamicibacter halophytocola TaxID=1933880 RepID=A0ABX5YAA2_9MICC|nr:hypothetical protein FQA45_09800 [Glutamicibacter halophytocola]